MAREWGSDDGADLPAERPAAAPTPSGWPSTLAGYAKVLAAALGGVPPAVVLTWLQSSGATHLPGWITPAVTLVCAVAAVLFGPRNRMS